MAAIQGTGIVPCGRTDGIHRLAVDIGPGIDAVPPRVVSR